MKGRIAAFVVVLCAALPLRAHGEQLIVPCVALYVVLPLALVLFIRWHRLWARLLTAGAFLAASALSWFQIMPRLTGRELPAWAELLLFLGPSLCALLAGAALRFIDARRAARPRSAAPPR